MKTRLFIISTVVILFGCHQDQPSNISIPLKQEPDEVFEKEKSKVQQKIKINPVVLQNGSTFLHLFAAYWKQSSWGELLQMTDKNSIRKYGKAGIEQKYKNTNLAMELELKSMVNNGDTYTLNYQTTEFATKRMLRLTVRVLPNDSVKLIIDDLDNLFH